MIGPASRRAAAVWVGAAIVAAVVVGPTGMQPAEITGLALHAPGVGAVLALIWLLVYLPIARGIVRADAAAYLRTVPGPDRWALVVGALALVGLQLPWLLLWVIGDGTRGLALVGAWTLVIIALARWRPAPGKLRSPHWRSGGPALRGIHLRALRRRAGDALLRAAGLAILAGVGAGLFVRNNGVTGDAAAVLGASVIAIALVPAQIGVLLVLLESHRASAWLAASLGIPGSSRVSALAFVIAVVHVAATLFALIAAALVIGPDPMTLALLAGTSLVVALGSALGETRALLGAEHSISVASRTVSGAVVVGSVVVLCLGTLGLAGLLAILAAGALALVTVPA